MYPPRRAQANDIVFITARILLRQYLLRPDEGMVAAFEYLLAHYAEKHSITLYEAELMSTHYHLVLKDTLGQRSAFLRDLNASLAGFIKAYRGVRGPVFSPRPNQCTLKTPEAVADKIGYTLANPVAAGAVASPKKWPGTLCPAAKLGRFAKKVHRPTLYFREDGALPEEATLRFELPECLTDLYGEEGTRELLIRTTKEQINKARRELLKKGRYVLGLKRAMKIRPTQRATSYEVFGDLTPEFATLGGGAEAFKKAACELRTFRKAYYQALAQYRAGHREAIFPYGTYNMARLFGVNVAPAPS